MSTKAQNKIKASVRRNLRSNRAVEDFALKALMVVAPVVGLITLVSCLVFIHKTSLPLVGQPSMAAFISLFSGLLSFGIFLLLYRQATMANGADSYLVKAKRPSVIFDTLSLGAVYSLIVIALTIWLMRVMAASFEGLKLDVYTASVLIGLACGLVCYGLIRVIAKINSRQIVNILAGFLVGGVTISMLTAQDPLWWEANFSTLGQATQRYTGSFYAFNLTLILSALAIIVLARHLYADMEQLIQGGSMMGVSKINAVKVVFVIAALGLGGVGMFPYKPDSFQAVMHIFSAGLVAIAFGALMILLRWLLPGLPKSFMAISYIALAALVAAYILFNFVGYLSLTAFELGCFAICFSWLYLFTQQIVNLKEKTLSGGAQS